MLPVLHNFYKMPISTLLFIFF